MAEGPYRIGLNETQVGLVVPEGIQTLMARVVGPHRAERLLVAGAMDKATAQINTNTPPRPKPPRPEVKKES